MPKFLIAIIFAFLVLTGSVYAGPPLITDDPDTPGDKKWEINIAYILEHYAAATVHQTPLLDLNYGVGDNIQLKYELPWIVISGDAGTRSGLGNSNAGVKWRFLDEKQSIVSMSTYPQLEFNNPTSSARRGIVDDGPTLRLPIEAAKTLGPIGVTAEVGYAVRRHNDDDQWFYGIILSHDVLENLTLMGEINGESSRNLIQNNAVFNIGTQWNFSKNYGLLASAGRSFRNGTDDPSLLLYLGIQLRLGD